MIAVRNQKLKEEKEAQTKGKKGACVLDGPDAMAGLTLLLRAAAAAAKGKPSLKAGFLEGDLDEAAYATTALDDDYDFSNVPAMAAVLRVLTQAPLPSQCEQGGAACAACERCCRARCVNTPCSQPRHPSAHRTKAPPSSDAWRGGRGGAG